MPRINAGHGQHGNNNRVRSTEYEQMNAAGTAMPCGCGQ